MVAPQTLPETYAELAGLLSFDLMPGRHLEDYQSVGNPYMDLFAQILTKGRNAALEPKDLDKLIDDFPKVAAAKGVRPEALVRFVGDKDKNSSILHFLKLARHLTLNPPPPPLPTPEEAEAQRQATLKDAYGELSNFELPALIGNKYAADYAAIGQAFPDEAQLIGRIMNYNKDLDIKEVDRLIDLPSAIWHHNELNIDPDWVKAYEAKVIPPLKAIKEVLTQSQQPGYTRAEQDLSAALEVFWQVHGPALTNVFNMNQRTQKLDQNLGLLLKAGTTLNLANPHWLRYKTDIGKLHSAIIQAIGIPNADRQPIFGPLSQAVSLLKTAQSFMDPHSSDSRTLDNAIRDYQRVANYIIPAKSAVYAELNRAVGI